MRNLATVCAALVLGGAAYAGCALNSSGLGGEASSSEATSGPTTGAGGAATTGSSSSSSSGGGMGGQGGAMATSASSTSVTTSSGGAGGGCGDILTDPLNCGGCGFQCSTNNVDTPHCVNGQCQPECQGGKLDCDQASNDGCETSDDDNAHCGACANDCTTDNGVCKKNNSFYRCGCSAQTDCGPEAMCIGDKCKCYPDGVMGNHCTFGEICPSGNTCSCNGGGSCNDSMHADGYPLQLCCPSGCADLRADNGNCGACGKTCPGGTACTNGECT